MELTFGNLLYDGSLTHLKGVIDGGKRNTYPGLEEIVALLRDKGCHVTQKLAQLTVEKNNVSKTVAIRYNAQAQGAFSHANVNFIVAIKKCVGEDQYQHVKADSSSKQISIKKTAAWSNSMSCDETNEAIVDIILTELGV